MVHLFTPHCQKSRDSSEQEAQQLQNQDSTTSSTWLVTILAGVFGLWLMISIYLDTFMPTWAPLRPPGHFEFYLGTLTFTWAPLRLPGHFDVYLGNFTFTRALLRLPGHFYVYLGTFTFTWALLRLPGQS